MSQAGSSNSSTCLTDLTLPANSLDTSTANVYASCFIIYFGVEIIAENESSWPMEMVIKSFSLQKVK